MQFLGLEALHQGDRALALGIVVAQLDAALLAQLAVGGRLVMPVGEREGAQWLLRLTRVNEHETRREELMGVRFVPLTGAQGWPG
ncbi:hypothetical protein [Piscinibacter sp.]|uniref:hypothetical protein n=1 Tax=Piscinibacter sp. TaxID=1903157 RepID=UPI003783685F